jgi:hypothetical protein
MNLKKNAVTTLLLLLSINTAHADEGMWIIHELNRQNITRMKELGFTPEPEYLFNNDTTASGIANAVVIFGGGCTGITVSDNGLVFTNHHCGYSSIQKLSSMENDYLKNGFVSQTLEEELPVEGLSVRYLKETIDVTDSIIPQIASIEDEYKRLTAADSIGHVLCESFGKDRFTEVEIVPFYSMNRYYLIAYRVYRDVRLVFTPPSSLGKFGGDTDNWMWPRHTCDFSVFRVYADAHNHPADYNARNQPYTPRFAAEISLQGYRDRDFTLTAGFPGSTDRYLSSWGVQQRMENSNNPRIEVRGIKQEIWQNAMQQNPAIHIKYASKYAGSSNYWKNAIGMNRVLDNLDVVERKRRQEEAFDEWIQQQSPDKKNRYANVLQTLREAYHSIGEQRKHLTYLSEAFANGAEIVRLTRTFNRIDNKHPSTIEIEDAMNEHIRPFLKDYEPEVDKKLLPAMLKIIKDRVPATSLPDIYPKIDAKYKGDYERYAEDLFAKTALLSEEKMIRLLKNRKQYARYTKKDPAAQLTQSVIMTLMDVAQSISDAEYAIIKGKRLYFAALREMYPDSVFYPDANFTLRISYGSTGGYHPFDAAWYDYYTTEKGLLEKAKTSAYDYHLQPEIVELIKQRKFGPYADENGNLRLCFLSNNDITGGNSGSPVFDKNGRIIGLAFDGNWEAMSGDIAFESELQRTISVDIRYVLWVIEQWGKCPRIIDELKLSHVTHP